MMSLRVLILIILTPVILFSQYLPDSFKLLDKNELGKSLSSDNPISNGIGDIIALGDTIWLGTTRGISLSTDNGETWTNTAFGDEGIAGIGYDKYNNIFWASTAHSEDISGIGTVSVGSGLHYTSDFGVTWNSVPQPVDDSGDSTLVYGINDGVQLPKVRALPVTVAQQNIIYDIDFTPNTIWIASWAGGIRRSTTMGQTWSRVLLPSDSLNSINPTDTIDYALSPVSGKFGTGWLNLEGFSIAAENDSTIYVGTADGINKTTDAEAQFPSWIKFNHLNQESPISGNFVVALDFNKADNILWGATWKANGITEYYGVSFSTNEGESWQVVLPHEQAHNFGFKGDQPIVATDDGAFRSSNSGMTWVLPGSIRDEKTNAQITSTVFYSAAASGNTIWIGSDQGLARLTETGLMWNGTWKVYISAPITKEVYAFPNPFAPRLDGKITFKYDTNDKNENVTIRIFDFGMNYLKTVIQNAPRKISLTDPPYDSWDGTDDNGNVVPNGVYFYRIEVGSNDPSYGKIMILQ
jgi:hypothetical protein